MFLLSRSQIMMVGPPVAVQYLGKGRVKGRQAANGRTC